METITKSPASRIKLAPKSVKPTDPRFSPIIKKGPPVLENGSNEDDVGDEDISQASESVNPLTGHVDMGVIDSLDASAKPHMDDTAATNADERESSAVHESLATRQPDEETRTESDSCTGENTGIDTINEITALHESPLEANMPTSDENLDSIQEIPTIKNVSKSPGQHEKQTHSNASIKVSVTTDVAASPATIIRRNSRAKIISELRLLPSIEKKRIKVARKIQGSNSKEEDTDEEEQTNKEGGNKIPKKPLPPPLPRRTTPPLKSQEHSKPTTPEQATPPENILPIASPTPTSSPITTPEFPHTGLQPMLQESPGIPPIRVSDDGSIPDTTPGFPDADLPPAPQEFARIPSITVSGDGSIPEESMPPPPPMSTHPEVLKTNTLPRSYDRPPPTTKPLPIASPTMPTSSPDTTTPELLPHADLPSEPQGPSLDGNSPTTEKSLFTLRQLPDTNSDLPPILPLKPTKIPPSTPDKGLSPPPPQKPVVPKRRSLHRPPNANKSKMSLGQEDEPTMPPPPPLSTHPEVLKASTLPRSYDHPPPTTKPLPRPRKINPSQTKNTSKLDTREEESSPNVGKPEESIKPPPPNAVPVVTETADSPSSPIIDEVSPHEPSVPAVAMTTTATTAAAAAATTAAVATIETAELSSEGTPTPSHSHVPVQQMQQQAAGGDVGEGGENPVQSPAAVTPSPSHSFFFNTAATAVSKPPTEGEGGSVDWGTGQLSVSNPTNVEPLMKCGPMNTKRSGTIKKKRSFLRRK